MRQITIRNRHNSSNSHRNSHNKNGMHPVHMIQTYHSDFDIESTLITEIEFDEGEG